MLGGVEDVGSRGRRHRLALDVRQDRSDELIPDTVLQRRGRLSPSKERLDDLLRGKQPAKGRRQQRHALQALQSSRLRRDRTGASGGDSGSVDGGCEHANKP